MTISEAYDEVMKQVPGSCKACALEIALAVALEPKVLVTAGLNAHFKVWFCNN